MNEGQQMQNKKKQAWKIGGGGGRLIESSCPRHDTELILVFSVTR